MKSTDIVRVTLDVDKADIIVEAVCPIDGSDSRLATYTERCHSDQNMPLALREAAWNFVRELMAHMNSRDGHTVKCGTCISACCMTPVHETTRVTAEDVERLRRSGAVVQVDMYDVPDFAGYVGQLHWKPLPSGERACTYLTPVDGCSVYAYRPQICRRCDPIDCKDYILDPRKLIRSPSKEKEYV